MKKLLTAIVLVGVMFLSTQNSYAQEIGARFGSVVGGNVAVDAVFSVGEFSRIHADVSFGNGLGVEALWDFFYRPVDIGGETFNWYAGAGPSLLFNDPFFFGISGEIGLEYHFDGIPIALGVDWRPTFWLVETTSFKADGFGFNARFVINQ
ncbi:MAG: outer membrane insertion C- signal [Cyclobacteriaceae bacterium]|nr:outer membrane insertion C- signal [Cyclobacteriaceae bacterium]